MILRNDTLGVVLQMVMSRLSKHLLVQALKEQMLR